jgi:TonB family protein
MTTAFVLNMEFAATQMRLRRTLTFSLAVHALLIAWLLLHRSISPTPEGIVEISWLEPAPPPEPTAAAPVPQEPVETAAPVTPSPSEEKFERRRQQAAVEPTPQEESAEVDRIRERVSSLTTPRLPTRALNAATTTSSSLLRSAPVPAEKRGASAPAVNLKRSQKPTSGPQVLKRGPEKAERNAPTLATVATESPTAAVAVPDVSSATRRSLGGAELVGEVADRPVIEHPMPTYPDWAKDQAVEGTVTLSFVVLPDGRVKENIQIQKTAGFADFDRNALAALARWRFAALVGGAANEQQGTITFHYRLRD